MSYPHPTQSSISPSSHLQFGPTNVPSPTHPLFERGGPPPIPSHTTIPTQRHTAIHVPELSLSSCVPNDTITGHTRSCTAVRYNHSCPLLLLVGFAFGSRHRCPPNLAFIFIFASRHAYTRNTPQTYHEHPTTTVNDQVLVCAHCCHSLVL